MSTTHSTTHSKESTHKAAGGDGAANPEFPAINIGKLLERFRLPGVDFPALMDVQRKNIEALRQANRKAFIGALAMAQRQVEILEENMREWQAAAKELTAKSSAESAMSKQADLAKKAIENALANMRELAEMAVKSQTEAYEVIGKRVQAGIQEFRDYLNKQS
jgi:phasin family protein